MHVGPGRGAPGGTERGGQLFSGRKGVAQMGQGKLRVIAEDFSINTRNSSENRHIEALQQKRYLANVGAVLHHHRGGADRPRVQKPGPQRIGPVQRARMEQAIRWTQTLPPVMHHPPRPDRAMGMGDGARRAGGARGHDDIGQPVGIAHRPAGGGAAFKPAQIRLGQDRAGRGVGDGDARPRDDHRRADHGGDARDLGRGQARRRRHRDDPGCDGTQKGQGKADTVAKAQHQPVAGLQTPVQQTARNAQNRLGQPPIAPPFGAAGAQDLKRDAFGRGLTRRQHIGGKVEGRGAGRGRAGVDDGKHGPWLRAPPGRCKP